MPRPIRSTRSIDTHQAQDGYHSPATPRSLLASPVLCATTAGEQTTALELLVLRSRSRSGCSTPGVATHLARSSDASAVPVDLTMGVLVLRPSVEVAAAQADTVAAERRAELHDPKQAATGAIDWTALGASLLRLSEADPTG